MESQQQSKFGELTTEVLNEYNELTYLSKPEIIEIFKVFKNTLTKFNYPIDVFNTRIDYLDIAEELPQLKCNPFRDRICRVFSSQKDGCYSFEDLLDLFSVMSHSCPNSVKANWAFRLFDFDEDNGVGEEDIMKIAERLTTGYRNAYEEFQLDEETKRSIAQCLLTHLDLESSGKISDLAFEHGIGKMASFASLFSFRL